MVSEDRILNLGLDLVSKFLLVLLLVCRRGGVNTANRDFKFTLLQQVPMLGYFSSSNSSL